jgi:UPF0755 protein
MKRRNLLWLLSIPIIWAFSLLLEKYQWIYQANVRTDVEIVELYIPSEADFETVLELLRRDSILLDEESFLWVADMKSYPELVKPGHYVIDPGLNNNELVNLLRSGGQRPVKVMFKDIDHLRQLAGVIGKQLEADSLALLRSFQDESLIQRLGFNKATIMANFLPNTYEFYWNTDAVSFVERMNREYKSWWTSSRLEKAKKIDLTPTEVVTLASIVEKEVIFPSEYPRVAGLYLNRLRKGWLLGSDPTIIFALQERYPDTVINRVLRKDLSIDSPYNTYENKGLPPGPICIPSLKAIEGVLNAEKHTYMYMVASVERPNYHEFSETLAQHNYYARQYHNWLNQQRVMR